MEKTKVDINILGQDISVMCTEEEKDILLKSRERIVNEAEKVKNQNVNSNVNKLKKIAGKVFLSAFDRLINLANNLQQ